MDGWDLIETPRKSRWRIRTLVAAVLLLAYATSVPAQYVRTANPSDSADLQTEIGVKTGLWIPASLTALIPFPPAVPIAADTVAFGLDVSLKYTPPVFYPPEAKTFAPLTGAAPAGCSLKIELDEGRAEYRNWLGINVSTGAASAANLENPGNSQWNELGAPLIYHFNTDVDIVVGNFTTTPAGLPFFGSSINLQPGPRTLKFNEGVHRLSWTAATQLDPVWDVYVPVALIVRGGYLTKKKYGEHLQRVAEVGRRFPLRQARYARILKERELRKSLKFFLPKLLIALPDKNALAGPLKCWIDNETKGNDVATQLCGIGPRLVAANLGAQTITVPDGHTPIITTTTPNPVVEASGFGGTLFERIEGELFDSLDYSDECDKDVYLTRIGPEFLPVGATPTPVTWRVTDVPPGTDPADIYPANIPSFAEVTQMITVQDTQPPLLRAPESISVETNTGSVDMSDVDLGQPQVVDYADPNVTVVNDAPGVVTADQRLGINWTASDSSNNATTKTQWLTVKTAGTNTPPTAVDDSVDAITAEVVEIQLDGFDADLLDGTLGGQQLASLPDRVSFEMVSYPGNGQLEAPLRPFFIEDFRVSPVGQTEADGTVTPPPLGQYSDVFVLTSPSEHATYLQDTICADTGVIPEDFVYQPSYVHVSDDGYYFIRDSVWSCREPGSVAAIKRARISAWDAERQYLGAYVPPEPQSFEGASDNCYSKTFDVGTQGRLSLFQTCIYTFGGQAVDLITIEPQYDNDGQFVALVQTDEQRFAQSEQEVIAGYRLRGIINDPVNDIVYINDSRGISVHERSAFFDNSAPLTMNGEDCFFPGGTPPFGSETGTVEDKCVDSAYNLGFGASCLSNPEACTAFSMDLDSQGNLYVAETNEHRIHKFKPSRIAADGSVVPGDYVGWMGRCSANVAPFSGCDEAKQTTRGFACDDAKCLRGADEAGDQPSQFNRPGHLVVDPNDIFYVADVDNRRVQRFSADGTFAGQANSTGTGIGQGDTPSFVLGNIGDPRVISVNSSTLFVVEADTEFDNFVHSFKTLPFFPIDAAESGQPDADGDGFVDNSVVVKYVSDFNFPGGLGSPQGTDSFSYRVNDGLADSNVATVTVNVERAYRPPNQPALRCYDTADKASEVPCELDEDTGIYVELIAKDPDGIVGFDGLDTLDYTLLQAPASGTLRFESGDAASALWYYAPERDFFGEDGFSYSVSDGRDSIDSPLLPLTVLPVPDPPTISLDPTGVAGRGFPTTFSGLFDDPDEPNEAVPMMTVVWADSEIEQQGEIVENPAGSAYYEATGPILTTFVPGASAPGMLTGTHTYLETIDDGFMLVCLEHAADATGNTTTCEPSDVIVVETASLAIDITASNIDPQPDEEISFLVPVVNQQPEGWAGFDVFDTRADIELPSGLVPGTWSPECMPNAEATMLSCDIGQLMPGQIATMEFTATFADDAPPEFIKAVIARGSHSVPNFPSEAEAQVDLIVDWLDTDGDGMPDAWEERYGLDPNTPDGELDADGEQLDNLDEYLNSTDPTVQDTDGDSLTDFEEVEGGTDPLVDSVAPEFSAPADVTVTSTGALTYVDFGTVTGTDALDGTVEAVADNPGPYAPGVNVVQWSVTDAAGNGAQDDQIVNVIPLVSFGVDQTVGEGGQAEVLVQLNGEAVDYPVQVNYTVDGAATNPEDHNASAGSLMIESGTNSTVLIDIVDDGVFEDPESFTLTMSDAANAAISANNSHTITIDHDNIRPRAKVIVTQQGKRARVVAANLGPVTVSARVRDANAGDSHTFDWSASDPSILDPADYTDESFVFDPSLVTSGTYRLEVQVVDDGVPMLDNSAKTLIKVVDSFRPRARGRDQDRDGVSDFDEGEGDNDGDGVANIDDPNDASTQLLLSDDGRMLETETGLELHLGDLAFSQGSYAEMTEANVGEDVLATYPNDLADFEVLDVEPGGTAKVVLPLRTAMRDNAAYRKNVSGNWSDLVLDENNTIASAAGTDGACPEPGSTAYAPGLNAGDNCVELTIEDGGPNDADATENNVIADPGGVAQPLGATIELFPASRKAPTGTRDIVMFEMRITSDSGEVELRSMTLQAAGSADDTAVRKVALVVDANANGTVDAGEQEIASGTYDSDNGVLILALPTPIALPVGQTDLLVTYDM